MTRLGIRASFAIACTAALGLSLPGCASSPHQGYVIGSTYASDVRTVAVPIFTNASFTPGLEQTLTEAVIREIQASTPWRVTGSDRADTVLTGVVRGSDLRRLSETPTTGYVQEQSLSVTADFRWRDNRTGDMRVERQRLSAATVFVPARGLDGEPGERVEIAQRDAIEELAQAIVHELRADF